MNSKEIKSVFEFLQKNEPRLSPGQLSFIGSLKKYFARHKRLTEKQAHILNEIAKHKLQTGAETL